MNKPPCGLFLDLDGTLADSLPVMRRVYDQFLNDQGRTGSDEEFAALNGPPLSEIVRILKNRYRLPESEPLLSNRYWQNIEAAYDAVQPKPGAEIVLKQATQRGRVVAVVTSSQNRLAQHWLRKTGLIEWISLVVGGDQVKRGKPAPDPYLLALEKSGCKRDGTLVVEDSKTGALSGIQAGLSTFVVHPDPQTINLQEWPAPCRFVQGLEQMEVFL
ncbi:MAG: HAD family phosphatase [Magnetococcales bacterium]|nr:HAD family phosphatase [Magnetococcales bacterium]